MNFQIDVSSAVPCPPAEPRAKTGETPETVELLRQMLEVQREQLACQRAAQDMTARWRAFLTRWQSDFPDLADSCRKALPHLERCYGQLLRELTDKLNDEDEQGLDNDFALQEFLDRFGMRLAQLGTILNLVAPLAEAANQSQGESAQGG
jgi:hypothetical protein